MTRTVSVRLDEEAIRALRMLESAGMTRSEAIRAALVEWASVRRRSEALRAEAERLARDEEDLKEVAAIQALMEDLREPW